MLGCTALRHTVAARFRQHLQGIGTLDFVAQQRWTPKRKAALLAEIEAGEMATGRLELIGMTQEELSAWRREFSDHGVDGLHVYSLHHHHPDRRRGARQQRHRG
jgi:Protein of unknown function (DUF1153)